MKATTASFKDIVERLEAVAIELARSPSLPAGLAGASLLDVLEVLDRARKAIRTAAKGMLVKSPNSLPGWTVAMPNGRRNPNAGLEWPDVRVRVQEHRRNTALKLIQQRKHGPALRKTKKGKRVTL